MASKIDPTELRTTQDLLKDFSVSPDITAEEVYRISWSRFNTLENIPFHEVLSGNLITRLLKPVLYIKLPLAFHSFLYEDLYTFAGQYRKSIDPHSGTIYYGRQHAHQRKPPFSGDAPEKIEEGVMEAVRHLKRWTRDPLYCAVRFYQKFVNIHPFYDGNGRISRLIANIYMADHKMTILWSEFDSKRKFIKKLNRCHLNLTLNLPHF